MFLNGLSHCSDEKVCFSFRFVAPLVLPGNPSDPEKQLPPPDAAYPPQADAGYPQQAYPQQAYPQQGYPQQAYPQQPGAYPQAPPTYPPQQGYAQPPPAYQGESASGVGPC